MCDKHSKTGDPAVGSTRLVRCPHQYEYNRWKTIRRCVKCGDGGMLVVERLGTGGRREWWRPMPLSVLSIVFSPNEELT
jgi:hypothetical protein